MATTEDFDYNAKSAWAKLTTAELTDTWNAYIRTRFRCPKMAAGLFWYASLNATMRGARATVDIAAGEDVCRVPMKSTISASRGGHPSLHALTEALGAALGREKWQQLSESLEGDFTIGLISLFVLRETSRPRSALTPYATIIEAHNVSHIPMLWPLASPQWAHASPLLRSLALASRNAVERAFAAIVPPAISRIPVEMSAGLKCSRAKKKSRRTRGASACRREHLESVYSRGAFLRTYARVVSRHFGPETTLVPVIDMLNYGDVGLRVRMDEASQEWVLHATRDIAAGSELLLPQYSVICREWVAHLYGFVPEGAKACYEDLQAPSSSDAHPPPLTRSRLAKQVFEAWRSGRPAQAMELQRTAASVMPGNARFHASLGAGLLSHHYDAMAMDRAAGVAMLREARAALTRSLRIDPSRTDARCLLLQARFSAVAARHDGAAGAKAVVGDSAAIRGTKRAALGGVHQELARLLAESHHEAPSLCPVAAGQTLADQARATTPQSRRSQAGTGVEELDDDRALRIAAEAAVGLRIGRDESGGDEAGGDASGGDDDEGAPPLLGPWVGDWRQLLAARRTLRAHRAHTIRSAFSDAFARRVHAALTGGSVEWNCSSATHGSHSRASEHPNDKSIDGTRAQAQTQGRCVAIPSSFGLESALAPMHAAPLTQLIAALTGEPVGKHILVEPTLLGEVDDVATLHHGVSRVERRVAFAWRLEEEWQVGDGGEVGVVCPEEGGEHLIPPLFNSLTLLRLHGPAATGMHAILPAIGQHGARRRHEQRVLVTGSFMLDLEELDD